MLRINLLPPYIAETSRRKKTIAGWAVVLVIIVLALGTRLSAEQALLAKANERKATADQNKTEYDKADADINKQKADIAQIQQKQDFIANAQKYNNAWPALFEMMRDVTSPQIILKTINLDPAAHKTLDFAGFAPNEMQVIRWWMYLRNNKDKFDSVFFNLPPHGYNPAEQTANGFGGPAGFRGMPGMPGFAGAPGGFGGPSFSGGPPMGMRGMMAGGPGAMGGGGRRAMMGDIMGGPGGFGGMPGGFGARRGGVGGAAGDVGPGEIEGRSGINFTAMAVLREALAGGVPAPSWPPPAAAPAGGMMGGYGGMMGGMPGMMGGMPGAMGGPPGMGGMPGAMGSMPTGAAPGAATPPAGAAPDEAGGGGLGGLKGRSSKLGEE